MEHIPHFNILQTYEDIFIKVNEWGKYERSDTGSNSILDVQYMTRVPNFVTNFQRM